MPAHWPGEKFFLDSNQEVNWQDLQLLRTSGASPDQRTPVGAWGRELQTIAQGSAEDSLKDRKIAELCFRILTTLRFGGEQGSGHTPQNDSRIWQDDDPCPGKALKKNAPEDSKQCVKQGSRSQPYSEVILAVQERRTTNADGQEKTVKIPIKLRLHRFVCWLAIGNPQQGLTHATHTCGRKDCLHLGHLKWGNASTNRADYLEQLAGAGRKRYTLR